MAQTLHAADPAIDVVALATDVLFDLGVGEDVEPFGAECLDHGLGQLVGLDDAVGLAVAQTSGSHRRVDTLGAEDRHLDAVVAVRDRQELGQLDRSGLGDRVRTRPEGGQQTGGRRRVQQVAAATSDHRWEHGPSGVEMRHHVEFPLLLPDVVRGVGEDTGTAGAGVGAEQVDRPVRLEGPFHQVDDVLLVGDVAGAPVAAEFGCRCGHRVFVEVGQHDGPGPFGQKGLGHGTSDASASAGDDHYCIVQFHGIETLDVDVGSSQSSSRRFA